MRRKKRKQRTHIFNCLYSWMSLCFYCSLFYHSIRIQTIWSTNTCVQTLQFRIEASPKRQSKVRHVKVMHPYIYKFEKKQGNHRFVFELIKWYGAVDDKKNTSTQISLKSQCITNCVEINAARFPFYMCILLFYRLVLFTFFLRTVSMRACVDPSLIDAPVLIFQPHASWTNFYQHRSQWCGTKENLSSRHK